jgi:hypothetical protein
MRNDVRHDPTQHGPFTRALVLTALALLTACGGTPPPQADPGYILIHATATLLTSTGDTTTLHATVYDAQGNPTTDTVTWHTSNPAVLDIDATGRATATTNVGSAQITARTATLTSAPLLLVIATVVPGAILVADAQVRSGPEATDDPDDYDLGWRYHVTLSGMPDLAIDDLLIGTGSIPLGGRITATEPTTDGTRVTLAITPLDELFTHLEIDQTLDLTHTRPDITDDILTDYTIRHHPDGSIEFTPNDTTPSEFQPTQATGTRALGLFECTTTSTFPFSLPKKPSFTITPTLNFKLDYTLAEGLRHLGTQGAIKATLKFEPKISASFEGTLACEAKLLTLTIPIGGPLALILGGQIPIGVGFELKGKLTIAELGLDTSATANAGFTLGITCLPSCEPYATGTLTTEPKITPKFPDPDEQFRLTLDLEPFAYADLTLGSRAFQRLQLQLLRLTLGARQHLDLATTQGQATDPAYANNFDLHALLKAKLGKDATKAMKLLKTTIKPLTITLIDLKLAESPRGDFTITPTTVLATTNTTIGDTATFTVTLSPTTYLGIDTIDHIEIFWRKPAGDDFTLESARPDCHTIPGATNQTTFTCTTDFLEEHEGPQTFHAYAHIKLFGVTLPIPLEINKDAQATIEVILCQPTTTSTHGPLQPASNHEQCEEPAPRGVYRRTSRAALTAFAGGIGFSGDEQNVDVGDVIQYSGAVSASATGTCDWNQNVAPASGTVTADVTATFSLHMGDEPDLLLSIQGEIVATGSRFPYYDDRWCGNTVARADLYDLRFDVIGGNVLMRVTSEYQADPDDQCPYGCFGFVTVGDVVRKKTIMFTERTPSFTEEYVLSPGLYHVRAGGSIDTHDTRQGPTRTLGHRFVVSFEMIE